MGSRPYVDLLPPNLAEDIIATADGASAVFLNQGDLAPLACELRQRLPPQCAIVLLSHGLESVDLLHKLRFADRFRSTVHRPAAGERLLGRSLRLEASFRKHIDHVFCLSPFEAEIERWLGARRVTCLPRTVIRDPLQWTPGSGRVGFVGTLDHAPNLEGLEFFAAAIAAAVKRKPDLGIQLRLVGGPEGTAQNLRRLYPFIDYLGRLPDEALRSEAATWDCFVHPLFCYARGCSTKLAVALGWEIPVVTTPSGCRGYEWREGQLPIASTAGGLADLALSMTDAQTREATRAQVQLVARTSPTMQEVGARFKAALADVGDRR